jgi:hypothetical protein
VRLYIHNGIIVAYYSTSASLNEIEPHKGNKGYQMCFILTLLIIYPQGGTGIPKLTLLKLISQGEAGYLFNE